MPLSLPKGTDTESFLDELLSPLLDEEFLGPLRDTASREWPVLLSTPEGVANFFLVLEGSDNKAYRPDKLENFSGDPEQYLGVVLREVVGNKSESNSLRDHRPNVLFVNTLLSTEFFIAAGRQADIGKSAPEVALGDSIDGLLYTSCGVDQSLRGGTLRIELDPHPFVIWLESNGLLPSS